MASGANTMAFADIAYYLSKMGPPAGVAQYLGGSDESSRFSGGTFPRYCRGASAKTCKEDTSTKKLAGAAATSHMKKCEADATAKCEADSTAKKLAGAAKTSHMKKCVADAVGS